MFVPQTLIFIYLQIFHFHCACMHATLSYLQFVCLSNSYYKTNCFKLPHHSLKRLVHIHHVSVVKCCGLFCASHYVVLYTCNTVNMCRIFILRSYFFPHVHTLTKRCVKRIHVYERALILNSAMALVDSTGNSP